MIGGCRPLDLVEVDAMVTALKSNRLAVRDVALFLLGYRTGFRISELLSIRIRDVFDGKGITPTVGVRRSRMKGSRASRVVELEATDARAAVAAQVWELRKVGKAAPDAPLFPSQKGGYLKDRSAAWRVIKDAARRAGLGEVDRIATHSMRKTFAADFHAAACALAQTEPIDPLLETSRGLGHVRIDSTVKYLRSDRRTTRRLISIMSNASAQRR